MKVGSKYYPLYIYFSDRTPQSKTTQIQLTFQAIEQLLNDPLPKSAQNRAWWSNRDTASALQAGAWVHAGYHVSAVDFEQKTVTFVPFKATYNIQKKDDEIVWNQDAVKALRKYMGLTQAKFAAEMGVRRQTVSEWENGVYEPDRSTAKHLELIAKQASFQI